MTLFGCRASRNETQGCTASVAPAGFTLVEIAMVMVIGGLLLAGLSAALTTYIKNTELRTTHTRMEAIRDALQMFLNINERLPCPARLNAQIDTAGFGQEAHTTECSSLATGGGLQAVNGDITGRTGRIIIGAVPVRSLNLPDQFIADSWGTRFTYAVTGRLADDGRVASPPFRFDPQAGTVNVIDRNGNPVATPAGSAHYVILSHGPNRSGGTTLSGTYTNPCPTGTAQERTNCSANGTFRQTTLVSDAASNDRFDDILLFRSAASINQVIPPGAIMAFDRPSCPDDWTEVPDSAGRFLVGAGNAPARSSTHPTSGDTWNAAARNYVVGSTGGMTHLRLQPTEVPSHLHTLPFAETALSVPVMPPGPEAIYKILQHAPTVTIYTTAATPPATVAPYTPPFIAFRLCRRT